MATWTLRWPTPKDNNVRIYLGEGDGTFLSNQTLTVDSPGFIVAADFNGDGRLDLATPNASDISVLLNSTAGFFPAVSYSNGGWGARSLSAADFDMDGNIDLVALSPCGDPECQTGGVTFLKGDGKGAFQFEGPYNAGSTSVVAMAAADFNGDGKLDLAVTDYFVGVVNILLGNGDGSFQLPATLAVGYLAWGVTAEDFNHDGDVDLAIAVSTNVVKVLLGDGHGAFGQAVPYRVGKGPASVVAADFNGDGNLDLGVTLDTFQGSRVVVLFGKGDGTFPLMREFPVGSGATGLAMADFNHDHAPDLATADVLANTVSVLMNSGGTFVTTNSSQNPAPVGQSVTFTATVAPSLTSPIPTGAVTFGDGATILATVPLDPSGQASFTTSSLSLGTHTIRTKYSGDPNFNPNTGKALNQIIQ